MIDTQNLQQDEDIFYTPKSAKSDVFYTSDAPDFPIYNNSKGSPTEITGTPDTSEDKANIRTAKLWVKAISNADRVKNLEEQVTKLNETLLLSKENELVLLREKLLATSPENRQLVEQLVNRNDLIRSTIDTVLKTGQNTVFYVGSKVVSFVFSSTGIKLIVAGLVIRYVYNGVMDIPDIVKDASERIASSVPVKMFELTGKTLTNNLVRIPKIKGINEEASLALYDVNKIAQKDPSEIQDVLIEEIIDVEKRLVANQFLGDKVYKKTSQKDLEVYIKQNIGKNTLDTLKQFFESAVEEVEKVPDLKQTFSMLGNLYVQQAEAEANRNSRYGKNMKTNNVEKSITSIMKKLNMKPAKYYKQAESISYEGNYNSKEVTKKNSKELSTFNKKPYYMDYGNDVVPHGIFGMADESWSDVTKNFFKAILNVLSGEGYTIPNYGSRNVWELK
jgi:hypothetical protein